MTKEELTEKIAQLEGVVPVGALPETFIQRVTPDDKQTVHFVRVAGDDIVLKASSQNRPELQATEHAGRLLDFALKNLHKLVGNLVTRLHPYVSGEDKFDTFLALGPSITKVVMSKGHFLQPCTYECYAINHIEFSGNETEAEATLRKRKVRMTDVNREVTPVIFGRYHKQTGQRSPKYLAVATHESTATDIKQMLRDGGVVEFENWERERVTLTTDQGRAELDATFSGETKSISVDQALKLMDELTLRGVEAA